jgi:hypothetical protein
LKSMKVNFNIFPGQYSHQIWTPLNQSGQFWSEVGFVTYFLYVRFEVLTPVVMKRTIFWDITPLKVNRRFRRTRLHLHDRRISQARNQLCLFLNPEDGGDMFLRDLSYIAEDRTPSSFVLCSVYSSGLHTCASHPVYEKYMSPWPAMWNVSPLPDTSSS